MKLSMETIRDLQEDPDKDEENRTAEEFHISMLTGAKPGSQQNDLSREAAQALRAASPLTRDQFFRKWG